MKLKHLFSVINCLGCCLSLCRRTFISGIFWLNWRLLDYQNVNCNCIADWAKFALNTAISLQFTSMSTSQDFSGPLVVGVPLTFLVSTYFLVWPFEWKVVGSIITQFTTVRVHKTLKCDHSRESYLAYFLIYAEVNKVLAFIVFESLAEIVTISRSVTIKVKAIEQYSPKVLFYCFCHSPRESLR